MRFFRTETQGRTFLCGVLAVAWLWVAGAAPAAAAADARPSAPPVTDLRVLIDISGSMKHNDPHNLRAPALRLLVGLMPEGTRAGVWTFGQYVNMLVPLGTVTPAWKRRALAGAAKINSRGLYTNIGGALEKATVDWSHPDPRYQRHILLLTDGMVDIAKSAQKNQTESQRILTKILPRLKAAGVHIHTIALSPNADRKLLQRLAMRTDGGFEQVDNADQLERVFLRLFEKVTPVETLPLHHNRFTVDKHIRDMTVLVFRKASDQTVRLVAPDGSTYGKGHTTAGMIWRHEAGYDMVTVAHPAPGEWSLEADIDPDNRVMVATNLNLVVGPLPNHALLTQTLQLHAHMLEDGKMLRDERLLKLTRFEAQVQSANSPAQTLVLHDDGINGDVLAGDGIYSATLPLEAAGTVQVSVEAKAPSFQRAYHHSMTVHGSPVRLEIAPPDPGHPSSYRIKALPDPSLVQMRGLQLAAVVGGKVYRPERMLAVDPPSWGMELPGKLAGQTLSLTVQGSLNNGDPLDVVVERVLPKALLAKPATAAPVPAVVAQTTSSQSPSKAAQTTDKTPKPEARPEPQADWEEKHWLGLTGLVIGINLAIAAIIAPLVWWWRRRTRRKAEATPEADAAEGENGGNE